jgi:hypothetical protein
MTSTFQECDQAIEPGADRGPPLLGSTQPITIADWVRAGRMLAEQVQLPGIKKKVFGHSASIFCISRFHKRVKLRPISSETWSTCLTLSTGTRLNLFLSSLR